MVGGFDLDARRVQNWDGASGMRMRISMVRRVRCCCYCDRVVLCSGGGDCDVFGLGSGDDM